MMDLLLCVEDPQSTEGWMKTGTVMVQVMDEKLFSAGSSTFRM